MITTFYFIQFVAFYLWQITASKRQPVVGSWTYALANKLQTRLAGAVLWLVTGVGFVSQWGLAGGIFGFLVGLMAVGSLSVAVAPFSYLRIQGVVALYICCVVLEILL